MSIHLNWEIPSHELPADIIDKTMRLTFEELLLMDSLESPEGSSRPYQKRMVLLGKTIETFRIMGPTLLDTRDRNIANAVAIYEQAVEDAKEYCQQIISEAKARYKKQKAAAAKQKSKALQTAQERRASAKSSTPRKNKQELRNIEKTYKREERAVLEQHSETTKGLIADRDNIIYVAESRQREDSSRARGTHLEMREAAQSSYEEDIALIAAGIVVGLEQHYSEELAPVGEISSTLRFGICVAASIALSHDKDNASEGDPEESLSELFSRPDILVSRKQLAATLRGRRRHLGEND